MKAEDFQSLELKMQAQEVIYLDTVRLNSKEKRKYASTKPNMARIILCNMDNITTKNHPDSEKTKSSLRNFNCPQNF